MLISKKMTQSQFDWVLAALGFGNHRLDYPAGDGSFIKKLGDVNFAGSDLKGVSLSERHADNERLFYVSYENSPSFTPESKSTSFFGVDTVYCRDFVQKLSLGNAKKLIDNIKISCSRAVVTAPFEEPSPLWNEGQYLGNKISIGHDAYKEIFSGFSSSIVEVEGKKKLVAIYDKSLVVSAQGSVIVDFLDLVKLSDKSWEKAFFEAERADSLQAELYKRASKFSFQSGLDVDYYRLGYKYHFPYPLPQLSKPKLDDPGIVYPWYLFNYYSLEEVYFSLGWAAQTLKNPSALIASRELIRQVATWPAFGGRQSLPDLLTGHAAKLGYTALCLWGFVDPELKEKITVALEKVAKEPHDCIRSLCGYISDEDDLLSFDSRFKGNPDKFNRGKIIHNRTLIGVAGAFIAAKLSGNPLEEDYEKLIKILINVRFRLQEERGFFEAVSYDGYVWDYLMMALSMLPENDVVHYLHSWQSYHVLEEIYATHLPGSISTIAPLSDVEPKTMNFKYSSFARQLLMTKDADFESVLRKADRKIMPADAIGLYLSQRSLASDFYHNRQFSKELVTCKPEIVEIDRVADGNYCLRLSVGKDDGFVSVVSFSSSHMIHQQKDFGTFVIGFNNPENEWVITDPGYQQYVPGDERDFTIGKFGTNTPVFSVSREKREGWNKNILDINGGGRESSMGSGAPVVQERKKWKRNILDQGSKEGYRYITLKMDDVYPKGFLDAYSRTFIFDDSKLFVVDDFTFSDAEAHLVEWHFTLPKIASVNLDSFVKVSLGGCGFYISSTSSDVSYNLHPGSTQGATLVFRDMVYKQGRFGFCFSRSGLNKEMLATGLNFYDDCLR